MSKWMEIKRLAGKTIINVFQKKGELRFDLVDGIQIYLKTMNNHLVIVKIKDQKLTEGPWERRKRIAKEVDTWPEMKKRLGGLSSNYCSELQPIRYSCNKEECMSCEYWDKEKKIGMNDVWCNFFHAFVGAIGGGDSCVHYVIKKEGRRRVVKDIKRPQTS